MAIVLPETKRNIGRNTVLLLLLLLLSGSYTIKKQKYIPRTSRAQQQKNEHLSCLSFSFLFA